MYVFFSAFIHDFAFTHRWHSEQSSAQTMSHLFFWMMSQLKVEHVPQEEVVILSQESVHGWMLLMESQMDVTGFMQTVTTEVLWPITLLTLQMVRVYSLSILFVDIASNFTNQIIYQDSWLDTTHDDHCFSCCSFRQVLLSPSQRNTQGQKSNSVLISERSSQPVTHVWVLVPYEWKVCSCFPIFLLQLKTPSLSLLDSHVWLTQILWCTFLLAVTLESLECY